MPAVRERPFAARLGWAYLLGVAVVAGSTYVLGIAFDVRIRRGVVLMPAALFVLAGLLARTLRRGGARSVVLHPPRAGVRAARAAFGISALIAVGLFAAALTQPNVGFDGEMAWCAAARWVRADRSVAPRALTDPRTFVSHPRYPLLMPLAQVAVQETFDLGDDRRAIKPLYAAFFPALLLVLFDVARRHAGTCAAALAAAALAAVPVLASDFGGADGAFSDLPLGAFFGSGLLLLLGRARRSESVAAALLLGAGVLAKNEGLPFALAALVAVAFFAVLARQAERRRRFALLAVAAAGVLAAGIALSVWRSRIPQRWDENYAGRLGRVSLVAEARARMPLMPKALFRETMSWDLLAGFGLAGAVILAAGASGLRRRIVPPLALTLCLCFGAYVLALLLTTWPGVEQIHSTWNRLVIQLTVPLGVLLALALRAAWRARFAAFGAASSPGVIAALPRARVTRARESPLSGRPLSHRAVLWLSLLLALLPLLPSWSYLASHPWAAMSVDDDNALLEIATRRAAHGEQLVGSYSRFGWNHPGPMQFTLMAPVYALTGSRSASVYAAALTWNTLWVLAAVFVAWRLGGSRLSLLTAGALALLLAHLGPGLVSHAWGPHATVLPLFLFVLLGAGFALRGGAWMPGLAFVGSFLVQTHLGTGPTVVALAGAALLLRIRTREPGARFPRRAAAWTACLLAVFWAPPLVEQLRDSPGNLRLILAFFRAHHEAHPFAEIVDPVTRLLGALPLSLATILVPSTSDRRGIGAGLSALALVALLPLAAASSRRRGRALAAALAILSCVAATCTFLSVLKIVGPPFDYLFLFAASVGAAGWLALAASASGEGDLPADRRRRGLAVAVAVLVSLLATDANVRGLVSAQPMPLATIPSVRTFSESLRQALLAAGVKRPLIAMEGDAPWIPAAGVVLELDRASLPFAIDEKWRPMFGRGYARNGREDAVVLFADGGPSERNDAKLVARAGAMSVWLLMAPSST